MSENTRTVYSHAVRRCTDEGSAAKHLDDAYASGFTLIGTNGGGADGNTIWLVFQRATVEVVAPTPPPGQPAAAPAPIGGGFGAAPAVQPVAAPPAPVAAAPAPGFGATSA